jgi:BirA family biotin operon repressor/biotin-[acetyl-CoA-carboxylase] ligase
MSDHPFPRSAALVPRLEVLEHADSTNDEAVRRATGADADAWPDISVIVTDDQRGGRGRLGRAWVAPAGKCLAISIIVRPERRDGFPLPMDAYGWLPLLAGVAMCRAVRSVDVDATVKWPNDVLVAGRKVCGILAELLPGTTTSRSETGAVIGAGVNLTLGEHELPVDTATSLALSGASSTDADVVLAAYLGEMTTLYRDFLAAGGDGIRSGLRDSVLETCETIGRQVRVELPGGEDITGTARDLDSAGRLIVETNGRLTAVAAGDVTHLRY